MLTKLVEYDDFLGGMCGIILKKIVISTRSVLNL